MTPIAQAATSYFAIVFTVGFLLGTLRVLVIMPQIGEALAVLLELPLMLIVSWYACSWLSRRFLVPAAFIPRLIMGGVAFFLVMSAELGLSTLGFNRTVADHFATYQTTVGLMGLLVQAAFGLMPVIQLRRADRLPFGSRG